MREVQNQLEKTRKVTDQNVMTKAQTRTKEDSNEMRRQERNERREDPTGWEETWLEWEKTRKE
jgi:hypothetical protein